jgi:hypothetical protein
MLPHGTNSAVMRENLHTNLHSRCTILLQYHYPHAVGFDTRGYLRLRSAAFVYFVHTHK